ncbi:HalOD1 output domain-containing protein [Halorubrum sp. N11]|uniref:HalOD1 output domain-containing protein n=1 Tax=Halorubrum sp. N11 TaxID=3402276 RepID=UPI003EBA8653
MKKSLLEQITNKIAYEENIKPENLELQLQNYVSTDAIRGLANQENDEWNLQFETMNHVVEIAGDDTVLIDGQ